MFVVAKCDFVYLFFFADSLEKIKRLTEAKQ